jgi:hypothetical protein
MYLKTRARGKTLRLAILLALSIRLVYFALRPRSDAWFRTGCAILDSRIIRAYDRYGMRGEPVLRYEGQYQIRYTVENRDYFLWAGAGFEGNNYELVEDRLSSGAQKACNYEVRYDPSNPAEAVAVPLQSH